MAVQFGSMRASTSCSHSAPGIGPPGSIPGPTQLAPSRTCRSPFTRPFQNAIDLSVIRLINAVLHTIFQMQHYCILIKFSALQVCSGYHRRRSRLLTRRQELYPSRKQRALFDSRAGRGLVIQDGLAAAITNYRPRPGPQPDLDVLRRNEHGSQR